MKKNPGRRKSHFELPHYNIITPVFDKKNKANREAGKYGPYKGG